MTKIKTSEEINNIYSFLDEFLNIKIKSGEQFFKNGIEVWEKSSNSYLCAIAYEDKEYHIHSCYYFNGKKFVNKYNKSSVLSDFMLMLENSLLPLNKKNDKSWEEKKEISLNSVKKNITKHFNKEIKKSKTFWNIKNLYSQILPDDY